MYHRSLRGMALAGLLILVIPVLAACSGGSSTTPTPAAPVTAPTTAATSPVSAPTSASTMAAPTSASTMAAPTSASTMAAPTMAAPTMAAPTMAAGTSAAPTMAATTSAGVPVTGAGGSANGKIAILLPESQTTRYEAQDLPLFKAKLQALGYNMSNLIYSNANQNASTQQSQAEAALTNGAKVLVLDPVDSNAASSIADMAAAQNVPVIAYDRAVNNSSGVKFYVSFNNQEVGKLQAQSLIDALTKAGKTNPTIVMINGAPTDNNAGQFKAGAHSVFDPLVKAGKLTIAKEYDDPDWTPANAQTEMTQALTALGNKVDGVYCANDGTASGAIAAMKSSGLSPLPPVTGQDAQVDAIQRILVGEQYMTVYKAIKPEAEGAATLAYDLLTGAQPESGLITGTTNNGKTDVQSVILTPVAVTKDNIKDTVIKDNFVTVQQVCTADFASACKDAGLQ
jgi:D-xylose transport system substrate-binding protein